MRALRFFRELEIRTRPIHPESKAALERRWSELPPSAKTANQLLGRFAVGCEGTHGVFPKCNLTCSPCYHSSDANRVRTDSEHTLREVKAQIAYFRRIRGPRAHAQLIGGEVSLLPAPDHAETLLAMRALGREPMSMTHGDFDYAYLLDLAVTKEGAARFRKLSFAAHFDSLMRGRRGAVSPKSESELNPFREKFTSMFLQLKREYGISSYLAHNMTITPSNVEQIAKVVQAVIKMPFDMMSFQPAAFVGDNRRWRESFKDVTIDDVWEQIQEGLGTLLPWQAIQFGDPRCNRTCVVIKMDGVIVPILDPEAPEDLLARDRFLAHFGGVIFGGVSIAILTVKLLRVLARYPGDLVVFSRYLRRVILRAGGGRKVTRAIMKRKIEFKTFVVHKFMDAAEVAPAWELMEAGIEATDPKVKEIQERLAACTYSMSHPETGRLLPACVQHSVLDPAENIALRKLLPIVN